MTSATDIITYVGIPLAVLGVLPILYTFLLAILNQRRIRLALLRHGHKPIGASSSSKPHRQRREDGFTIRSSPMTTLIEVELPKYAVAPFERSDERYWRLDYGREGGQSELMEHERLLVNRVESTLSTIEEGRVQGYLRGGSWRAFHWKKLIVGKKLYRIQYEDELREPPAEVDFADLVHFMLDWGAELDPMGWEKLRAGGLWTPAGTVLLRLKDEDGGDGEEKLRKQRYSDWILRTSMPDESDGILSLCIRWPGDCHDLHSTRGAVSLPPGWGRLKQPPLITEDIDDDQAEKDVPENERSNNEKKNPILARRIHDLRRTNKQALESTSMRFKVDSGVVSTVYWEYENREIGTSTSLVHLDKLPHSQSWFTTAISSLLLTQPPSPNNTGNDNNGTLWGFEPPQSLTTFTRKDAIPVGILVLLDLLHEDQAPHWTTLTADNDAQENANRAREHARRFEARFAAERLEASMPPEQRRVAKANRATAEMREMMDDSMRTSRARREMEERRMQDALVSARMGTAAVAELCLTWLKKSNQISPTWSLWNVVEAVLYLLVLDRDRGDSEGSSNEAEGKTTPNLIRGFKILQILDEWMCWANAGGMKREQFQMLHESKIEFCLAACLVAVVQQAALTSQDGKGGMGKASVDMMECLNLWRKIRLG